jgi:hypothetical protein
MEPVAADSSPPIARATGPHDKYRRASDERGGAASVLVGIAANKCFQTRQPVQIASLVSGLKMPVYPPMPNRTDPVPMPRPTGAANGGGIAPQNATNPAQAPATGPAR